MVYRNQVDSYTLGQDVKQTSTFSSYRNPDNVYKYVGYKREEVYSFTFTPIVNGRAKDAYHIPAMTPSEASAIFPGVTNVVDRVLTSTEKYPTTFPNLGQTVLKNTPIRYHKMPSNSTSPFVTTLTGEQVEQHNVLGLIFNIRSQTDWKSNCDGYIIARENRRGKETRGAQGVIKKFYA